MENTHTRYRQIKKGQGQLSPRPLFLFHAVLGFSGREAKCYISCCRTKDAAEAHMKAVLFDQADNDSGANLKESPCL